MLRQHVNGMSNQRSSLSFVQDLLMPKNNDQLTVSLAAINMVTS